MVLWRLSLLSYFQPRSGTPDELTLSYRKWCVWWTVPFISLLLSTTYPKDPLVGLWYPIVIAALCFIIGTIYLTNKIDKDVTDQ